MLAPERTALILLAAGRSLRFTDADKLAEPFLDVALFRRVAFAVPLAINLLKILVFVGVKMATADIYHIPIAASSSKSSLRRRVM